MTKNKLSTSLKTLAQFFGFSLALTWKASRGFTVMRIVIELLSAVISAAGIFAAKLVIDAIADPAQYNGDTRAALARLIFVIGLSALLAVVRQIAEKVRTYAMGVHNDIISNQIRLDIAHQAARLDLEHFDNPAYYDILSNAQRDSYAIMSFSWSVMTLLRFMVQLVISTGVIVSLNVFWGILFIALSVPSSLAEINMYRSIYLWQKENIGTERKMDYITSLFSIRSFAKDIRFYGLKEHFLDKYTVIWREYFSRKRKLTFRKSALAAVLTVLPEIALGVVSVMICMDIVGGVLTVGDYGLYTGFIASLIGSVYMLSHELSNTNTNFLRIQSYQKLMELNPVVRDTGLVKPEKIRRIEFQDITFLYPGTGQKILEHISFTLNTEEVTALVGLNGAGKSTIIKLLLRYYDPTEGVILADGIPLSELDLTAYRQKLSVLFQDFQNYAFTLAENISLSDVARNSDCAAVEAACRMSEFGHLGEKLDCYVTRQFDDAGIELSGGEAQKVALARAFFRGGDYIILDEPSSSLDPQAEHEIFERIGELCRDKGALFVSHRLSNVVAADHIIVIADGKAAEQGSHPELMAQNGEYAKLFRLQAEKYIRSVEEGVSA